jgi:DNA-binding LacI/PurR family transcriptional regulator
MAKARTVNLDDIAAATGFGRATVARALSEDNKYPMSAATRDAVRAAARAMGYAPSWGGRVLATGKTRQIGLIHAGKSPIITGILGQVLQTVPADLTDAGYRVMLVPVVEDSDAWISQVEGGGLDGCLILPPTAPSLGRAPLVPTVLINLQMGLGLPTVLADDRGGAALLTRHLLGLGHRRILFLHPEVPNRHYSAVQREASFRESMLAAGAAAEVFAGSVGAAIAVCRRSETPPTAVIVYDHYRAVELLHHLWRAGIRVPHDLSVACFNEAWPVEVSIPPLTTVKVPIRAMAHHAVRLLLDRLAGGQEDAATVVLPEELVVRESTAPPRG